MKASQPVMNLFIMTGVVLGAIKIMIIGLEITDNTCIIGLWFGHLAFVCGFGAIFLKTYRIHILMNAKSLQRISFSTLKVVGIMSSLIIFAIIWLILLTLIGKPHRSLVASEINNQTFYLIRCSYVHSEYIVIIFCWEALLMLYGCLLIFQVRNVPSGLNESKNIAVGKFSFLFLSFFLCLFTQKSFL